MILTISRSAPSGREETTTVIDRIPVETRATFDQTDYVNMTSIVLSADNAQKWAHIPGDFGTAYNLDVNVNLFTSNNDYSDGPQIDDNGSEVVSFHPTMEWASIEEGTVEYQCTGCMMKTVTATPTYTVPADEETALKADIVETLNYGALSTWYKLENAPLYKKAW